MAKRSKKISFDEIELAFATLGNRVGSSPDAIRSALEQALAQGANKVLGEGVSTTVTLKITKGKTEMLVYQQLEVVEDGAVTNPKGQCEITEAKTIDESLEVGDVIQKPVDEDSLAEQAFERIAAKAAKVEFRQLLAKAERKEKMETFHKKITRDREQGRTAVGLMKGVVVGRSKDKGYTIEFDFAPVDAPDERKKISGFLPIENTIVSDRFRERDVVLCYFEGFREEERGAELLLSRINDDFIRVLFEREVPAIEKGEVDIVKVARVPGIRSKVAVKAMDRRNSPVKVFVGSGGTTVQNVRSEVCRERVDIVVWDEDPAQFILNLLPQGVSPKAITVDELTNTATIVVNEAAILQDDNGEAMDAVGLIIGDRGTNVELIRRMVGLNIRVVTEAEAVELQKEETKDYVKLFMDKLDIDEALAQNLANQNFLALKEISGATKQTLVDDLGISEEVAATLKARAMQAAMGDVLEATKKKSELKAGLLELVPKLGDDENKVFFEAILENNKTDLYDLALNSGDELIEELGLPVPDDKDEAEQQEGSANALIGYLREELLFKDKEDN